MFSKDAKAIATQTRFARTHCIKTLNNLIFENDSRRLNKKELREFTGFDFKEYDYQFTIWLTENLDDFYKFQFTSIANSLNTDNHGFEAYIMKRFTGFNRYRNLSKFVVQDIDSGTETEIVSTNSRNVLDETRDLRDTQSSVLKYVH